MRASLQSVVHCHCPTPTPPVPAPAPQCIDNIAYFQQQTGAQILFNLPRQTDRNGAYDPTVNATALLQYVASKGYGPSFSGWEVGNELTGIDPTQYAADLKLLKVRVGLCGGR